MPAFAFDPDALRHIRRERGLSQTKLAARLGLNNRAISLFECGNCGPSVSTLANIASVLGVRMDEFIKAADDRDAVAS